MGTVVEFVGGPLDGRTEVFPTDVIERRESIMVPHLPPGRIHHVVRGEMPVPPLFSIMEEEYAPIGWKIPAEGGFDEDVALYRWVDPSKR